jgi:DNA-binding transcriptional MerR regulator
VYGDEDVDRLAFIRRSQRFGLSLDEIGEVLAFRQKGQRPCGFVLDAVRRRAAGVDDRIAELIQLRAELGDLIERADGEAATPARYCHLLERDGG